MLQVTNVWKFIFILLLLFVTSSSFEWNDIFNGDLIYKFRDDLIKADGVEFQLLEEDRNLEVARDVIKITKPIMLEKPAMMFFPNNRIPDKLSFYFKFRPPTHLKKLPSGFIFSVVEPDGLTIRLGVEFITRYNLFTLVHEIVIYINDDKNIRGQTKPFLKLTLPIFEDTLKENHNIIEFSFQLTENEVRTYLGCPKDTTWIKTSKIKRAKPSDRVISYGSSFYLFGNGHINAENGIIGELLNLNLFHSLKALSNICKVPGIQGSGQTDEVTERPRIPFIFGNVLLDPTSTTKLTTTPTTVTSTTTATTSTIQTTTTKRTTPTTITPLLKHSPVDLLQALVLSKTPQLPDGISIAQQNPLIVKLKPRQTVLSLSTTHLFTDNVFPETFAFITNLFPSSTGTIISLSDPNSNDQYFRLSLFSGRKLTAQKSLEVVYSRTKDPITIPLNLSKCLSDQTLIISFLMDFAKQSFSVSTRCPGIAPVDFQASLQNVQRFKFTPSTKLFLFENIRPTEEKFIGLVKSATLFNSRNQFQNELQRLMNTFSTVTPFTKEKTSESPKDLFTKDIVNYLLSQDVFKELGVYINNKDFREPVVNISRKIIIPKISKFFPNNRIPDNFGFHISFLPSQYLTKAWLFSLFDTKKTDTDTNIQFGLQIEQNNANLIASVYYQSKSNTDIIKKTLIKQLDSFYTINFMMKKNKLYLWNGCPSAENKPTTKLRQQNEDRNANQDRLYLFSGGRTIQNPFTGIIRKFIFTESSKIMEEACRIKQKAKERKKTKR